MMLRCRMMNEKTPGFERVFSILYKERLNDQTQIAYGL